MKKNAVVEYMEEMANSGWYVDHCNVEPCRKFPEIGMVQFVMIHDERPGQTLTITGCHRGETIVRLRSNFKVIADSRI